MSSQRRPLLAPKLAGADSGAILFFRLTSFRDRTSLKLQASEGKQLQDFLREFRGFSTTVDDLKSCITHIKEYTLILIV